jgi:hypothetical protein
MEENKIQEYREILPNSLRQLIRFECCPHQFEFVKKLFEYRVLVSLNFNKKTIHWEKNILKRRKTIFIKTQTRKWKVLQLQSRIFLRENK